MNKKNILLFSVSESISILTMVIWGIAIAWIIVTELGATSLAIYSTFLSISAMFFIPLLSPIGERLNKKYLFGSCYLVLIFTGVGRALIVTYLDSPLLLLILNDVIAAGSYALTRPAALPTLISMNKENDDVKIISFFKTSESIGRLIAPVLGGLLLAINSTENTLSIIVCILIIPLVLVNFINFPKSNNEESKSKKISIIKNLKEAVLIKFSIPQERFWFILSSFALLIYVPVSGYILIIIISERSLSPTWLGSVQTSLAAGGIFGYAIFGKFILSKLSFVHANAVMLVFIGISFWPLALYFEPTYLVVSYFFTGMFFAAYSLNNQTIRLVGMPGEYRVRINSLAILSGQLISSIAVLVTTLLHSNVGLNAVILFYSFLFSIIGFLFLFTPHRKEFELELKVSPNEVYKRLYPAVFKSE